MNKVNVQKSHSMGDLFAKCTFYFTIYSVFSRFQPESDRWEHGTAPVDFQEYSLLIPLLAVSARYSARIRRLLQVKFENSSRECETVCL